MGTRAHRGCSAFRGVLTLIAACFAHSAFATPPSFTGNPIRAEVPDFRAPTTINLRQLGVITGTAPLQFTDRTVRFLVNGEPTPLVLAEPVGNVCVTLVNVDFTPRPGETYAVLVGVRNEQGVAGPLQVPFTNTPGPIVDPQSPECADPNTAPSASIAGGDRSIDDTNGVPGEPVAFAGSGLDAQGDRLTFQWFVNGSAAPVATGATATLALADGASRVTLRVTDEAGLFANTTVSVTVAPPAPPPLPPTVDIGPATRTIDDSDGEAGEQVTFTSTASDPDGRIVEYQWLMGDSRLGNTPTITAFVPDGVNVITLVVIDDQGLTAEDSVQVTVVEPDTAEPQPPTANAGLDRIVADTDREPGELVTLTGTATDPDGTIASYEWLLGTTSLGTGATVQARIPDGVNTITLRVRDNTGLTASDSVQITVAREAQTPTANAGADQTLSDSDGLPGEVATLSGTGADSDGTIASYQWFVGDSPLGSGATLAARVPDGATTVTLVVTDDSGLTASDTVQIIVTAPVLPIVNAGAARTVADTDLQPGESVQLSGSATTEAGTITSYEWLLGDTALGNGASITARLPDGVNVVTLRARNSLNLVGSASVQITVGAPARTVLADLPGLTPNERRLAIKLDEACGTVLAGEVPVTETAPGAAKGRPPTEEERADFAQKCRGLVYSRNTSALVDAMGELLGDDFAVARTQTLLFANTQYASVMDRLIALRGGARGLSLAGLNIVVDGELVPLAELQDFAKMLLGGGASSDADSWGENWGLWMRGNYSFGHKDEDSLSPSFDAAQYALLAGLDYRFSSNTVVGAALAYGNSSVEFDPSDAGGLDTESWAISLYGSWYAARNFFIDGIVNIADSSYDAQRNITYVDGFGLVTADATGQTGGLTTSAGVSGGYDFLIGGLTLSPTFGVFYIDAQIDELTERGAGGLNLIYDEQQFKSLTANLGLRATFAWNLSWGVLLPHLRADYVREFEDDVDVFGIRFASDPNAASTPPILVETENPDTSYWRFAAGFSAQFKYGVSGYVEYQRLESFQFISFQDVSLGLRFQRSF